MGRTILDLRLLPYHRADGVWNMAGDEVLLESAIEGQASLRFYGWDVPTLTLGYFQASQPARYGANLGDLPFVRRPTGGAALVHHHELTYALALPATEEWRPYHTGLIPRFHRTVQRLLALLGISTQLCEQECKLGEVLCFLHHTPGDLLLRECKIAGSAQRKKRGSILQHGGILLSTSPHAPQLAGIAELTDRTLSSVTLQDLLLDAIQEDLNWKLRPGDWSRSELDLLEERSRSRYKSLAWNEKR